MLPPFEVNADSWAAIIESLHAPRDGGPPFVFPIGLTLNLLHDYAPLVWAGAAEFLPQKFAPHSPSAIFNSRYGFTSETDAAKQLCLRRGLAGQPFSDGCAKRSDTSTEQNCSERFGHWASLGDAHHVEKIYSPAPVTAPSGSAGDVAK